MCTRSKSLLAGLTAALALGALVSAASANRFAFSSQQFRATWNVLRFIERATIECHATIEGSFHSRTISKVLEALIGYVTRATVSEGTCTGGSARFLTETLPWHIRYNGFRGTLPTIKSILFRMVGVTFQMAVGGLCLYRSTASSPLRGRESLTATGVAEDITPEEFESIPSSSGILCNNGRLGDESTSLTQGANTTKITVTLIQ